MTSEPSVRVFFEPRIAPHPPELYAFDHVADGVDAAAAKSLDAVERYRADGFLVARGMLPPAEIDAAKAELQAMARADRPDCGMIWYEGALRDHLSLDPNRDRAIDAEVDSPGSSWARRVAACRRSIRHSAPATCASSWASSAARRP